MYVVEWINILSDKKCRIVCLMCVKNYYDCGCIEFFWKDSYEFGNSGCFGEGNCVVGGWDGNRIYCFFGI